MKSLNVKGLWGEIDFDKRMEGDEQVISHGVLSDD